MNHKVGDWYFVPYSSVGVSFNHIEEGGKVPLIAYDGSRYYIEGYMKVTHKRLGGISGELVEIEDEVQELER